MNFIGILLYRFLSGFGPKWSGKVPNNVNVIMGGSYSQTPYGDFWTDSGKHFVHAKRHKSWKRPGADKPFFFWVILRHADFTGSVQNELVTRGADYSNSWRTKATWKWQMHKKCSFLYDMIKIIDKYQKCQFHGPRSVSK